MRKINRIPKRRYAESYGILLLLGFILIAAPFRLAAQSGPPHSVYGTVQYSGGTYPASLSFDAYISDRPGEILTQDSTGCGYQAASGQWFVQCGNFPTSWSPGETLHLYFSDGSGLHASLNFTLTSNPVDNAPLTMIIRNSYSITFRTEPPGFNVTIDGTSVSTPVVYNWIQGSQHTLSAPDTRYITTDNQYIFSSWSNGQNREHVYTVPSQNSTVTASYTEQYSLTLLSEFGTPSGGGWYDSGAQATFSIASAVDLDSVTRKMFLAWEGEGSGSYTGTDTAHTLVMNGPVTETARWETGFFASLDLDPPSGGTVSPSPPGTWCQEGGWFRFTAFPDTAASYTFSHWSGDHSSTANPDSIPVTGPVSITAHFTVVQTDFAAPALYECYPPHGGLYVPRNGLQHLIVKDPAPSSGIPRDSISIWIDDRLVMEDGIARTSDTMTLTPLDGGYRFKYASSTAFSAFDTVTIQVRAQDGAFIPNILDSTFSYVIGPASIFSSQHYIIPPRGIVINDIVTGLELTLPSGSFSDTLDLEIGKTDLIPELPDTCAAFGTACFLGPYGFTLKSEASLAIPYTSADLSNAEVTHPMELPVYGYSGVSGQWFALVPERYTPEKLYVSFRDMGYITFARHTAQNGVSGQTIPQDLSLEVYPNPFNQGTSICFTLPESGEASLFVYNLVGREIWNHEGMYEAGTHQISWQGVDTKGRELSSGVYLLVIKYRDRIRSAKCILNR
jgi:hypothetical protein